MPFCLHSPRAAVRAAARIVLNCRRRNWCGPGLLMWTLLLPVCAGAMPMALSKVHFSDTMSQQAGLPEFGPEPAPWLLAVAVAEGELPGPAVDAQAIADRMAAAAAAPLLEPLGEDKGEVTAGLTALGTPTAEIRLILPEAGGRDDGSAAYLMVSSLVLFGSSSVLGYFTRQRPAYSVTDEPNERGGRPSLPPLLLPPVPIQN